MPIYEFGSKRPQIAEESYVHPEAVIIGNVKIEGECFIGPGAVMRADFGSIVIQDGTSIQDNVVIHADEHLPGVLVERDVIVGHSAILHDAHIKPECVIGMGAILLYDVVCEEGVFVAAGSVVSSNTHIPAGKLAAGNPARIIKNVSPEQVRYAREGVQLYRKLVREYRDTLRLVSP
ncbi:MAG: gamma carbonic anhydrase family protein [Deltaproteobacteria bacterium]|nr:gamma carbonic anhydrase family protein [Deltaproteobacteria bacterium]